MIRGIVIRDIVMELTPEIVARISEDGGTLRGAMQVAHKVADRGGWTAVVGIPKTIDNDIPSINQSFGFQTAFAEATKSIRAAHVEANPFDSVYCIRLAQNAVYAAMAGRTEMVVGRWRGRYVHILMALAVSRRNEVCPDGDLWLAVLEASGQPATFA